MSLTTPTRAGQSELEAAQLLLLERMGITLDQLLQAAKPRRPAPTFAEYIPVVEAAVGPGTRRVYGTYWNRLRDRWGQRTIDEPTPSQVKQLCEDVRAGVGGPRQGIFTHWLRHITLTWVVRNWSHARARATVSLALVVLTLIPVAFLPRKREQSRPHESDEDSAPMLVH